MTANAAVALIKKAIRDPMMKSELTKMCKETYYLKHEREIQLVLNGYLNAHLPTAGEVCVCENQKVDLDIRDINAGSGLMVEMKYQYWYDYAMTKAGKLTPVGKKIVKDIANSDIFILVIHDSDMKEAEDDSHFIGKSQRKKNPFSRAAVIAKWKKEIPQLKSAQIISRKIVTPTIFAKRAIKFRFDSFILNCTTASNSRGMGSKTRPVRAGGKLVD